MPPDGRAVVAPGNPLDEPVASGSPAVRRGHRLHLGDSGRDLPLAGRGRCGNDVFTCADYRRRVTPFRDRIWHCLVQHWPKVRSWPTGCGEEVRGEVVALPTLSSAEARPMKVVIPGGTGQVGMILCRAFVADGHEVVVLSRKPGKAPWRVVEWDAATLGDWVAELEGAAAVINLAGRSVNCRYHTENRRLIKESRVVSTRIVGEAIAR